MSDELVLSVQQPWAWAILFAGKDVENRPWRRSYRGRLWIHAAKADDLEGWAWLRSKMGRHLLTSDQLPHGAIVGTVQLVDIVRNYPSAWAAPDRWHWILRDPLALAEPIPARGQPGLFPLPEGACSALA